jgi:hypothetical protein
MTHQISLAALNLRGHHHLQKDSELLGYVKRCAKVVREGGVKENITNCPDVNDEVGSSHKVCLPSIFRPRGTDINFTGPPICRAEDRE